MTLDGPRSAATPAPATAAAIAAAGMLATACSVLPPRGMPAAEERWVEVEYHFGEHPPPAVEVPASRPGITVYELHTEPADLPEVFDEDRRWLQPSTAHLVLRCRYRAWTTPAGTPPPPSALFPGAASVRTLQHSVH